MLHTSPMPEVLSLQSYIAVHSKQSRLCTIPGTYLVLLIQVLASSSRYTLHVFTKIHIDMHTSTE